SMDAFEDEARTLGLAALSNNVATRPVTTAAPEGSTCEAPLHATNDATNMLATITLAHTRSDPSGSPDGSRGTVTPPERCKRAVRDSRYRLTSCPGPGGFRWRLRRCSNRQFSASQQSGYSHCRCFVLRRRRPTARYRCCARTGCPGPR